MNRDSIKSFKDMQIFSGGTDFCSLIVNFFEVKRPLVV